MKVMAEEAPDAEHDDFQSEVRAVAGLDHPHIVSYRTSFFEKGELIIIMEFCEMGDLANQVKKAKKEGRHFTESQIMQWFVQLCMSLEYIHRKKILHRDLKS